jgi:hypothetical protein
MGNGQWGMVNGEWSMVDGKWLMSAGVPSRMVHGENVGNVLSFCALSSIDHLP